MQSSILFVCLGNICRSPTAEGVFRAKLAEDKRFNGIDLHIDSAGTGDWHVGKSPDARAQQAAKGRGYDLSGLRARQVESRDFKRFDFILAMDNDNLSHLQRLGQAQGYSGHVGLFLAFGNTAQREVPDPYYGGEQGFQQVLDLIENASLGLLDHLHQVLKA